MRAEELRCFSPKMAEGFYPGSSSGKHIRERLSSIMEDRTPSPVQRSAMAVLAAHEKWAEAEMKKDAAYQEFLSKVEGLPCVPGGHSKSMKCIHGAVQRYISTIQQGDAHSWAK